MDRGFRLVDGSVQVEYLGERSQIEMIGEGLTVRMSERDLKSERDLGSRVNSE